jgi:hypothetical protein
LIAWPIDLVTGLTSVAVFFNYIEIVTSTKLAALSELIVYRFFALLIGGNASIESGFHG